MTKLYVGQLSPEITDEELGQLFSDRGLLVTSARVTCDREGGRSRGFGFVELGSGDDAQHAIEKLNGTDIRGRKILVREAHQQGQPVGRGDRATSVKGGK